MLILLKHHWLEKKRALNRQSSIFISILTGVIGFYILANILVAGWYADVIIQMIYPTENVMEAFTGLLFFYFLYDFFARFLFQKIPVFSIQPYLTLPVKKSRLFHHILLKSIPGFFNLLAIFLFTPFIIKVVLPGNSWVFSISWMIIVLTMVFINNFFSFALKSKFSANPFITLALLILSGTLIYLELTGLFIVTGYFASAVFFMGNQPVYSIIPLLGLFAGYYISFRILENNSWLEIDNSVKSGSSDSFHFLHNFGQTGLLIALELKMIVRNKRPLSLLWMSLYMFAYFLFMFFRYDEYSFTILSGFLVIVFASFMYGQYVFAWESSFFESYHAHHVSVLQYLKSKYMLIVISTIIPYIIAMALFFRNIEVVILFTVVMLYNIGINSMIILYFGCFKRKRISPGQSPFFNYEGVATIDFLAVIPVVGVPALVYGLFGLIGYVENASYALGIIGLLGIVFSRTLLQFIKNHFVNHKHAMVQGFRTT
jgi:hypothetical protein